jgi:hypothetical protein
MEHKPRSEAYMRSVQNFGEQHPDFRASHKEYKKTHPEVFSKAKSKALEKSKGEFEKWRSSRTGTHSKSISKKLGIKHYE